MCMWRRWLGKQNDLYSNLISLLFDFSVIMRHSVMEVVYSTSKCHDFMLFLITVWMCLFWCVELSSVACNVLWILKRLRADGCVVWFDNVLLNVLRVRPPKVSIWNICWSEDDFSMRDGYEADTLLCTQQLWRINIQFIAWSRLFF